MGTSAVNYRRISAVNRRENLSKNATTATLHHFFCVFYFILIHYAIDVYALISC